MREIGIMEVGGFRVGHAQNREAATGCTVLLCDQMSPAGLDVRGGGPASRESQLLSPVAQADAINAVLLSGGSAFGLDAAGGVQRYLEERGIGFDVGVTKVPLVCQSCLFDLGVGRTSARMRLWPIRPVKMPAVSRPQRETWELERAARWASTVGWSGP